LVLQVARAVPDAITKHTAAVAIEQMLFFIGYVLPRISGEGAMSVPPGMAGRQRYCTYPRYVNSMLHAQ
jgi:hypothetical protein